MHVIKRLTEIHTSILTGHIFIPYLSLLGIGWPSNLWFSTFGTRILPVMRSWLKSCMVTYEQLIRNTNNTICQLQSWKRL